MPVLGGVKRRAEKLGVPYQTLMQLWLAERLEIEEAKISGSCGAQGQASEAGSVSSLPRHRQLPVTPALGIYRTFSLAEATMASSVDSSSL